MSDTANTNADPVKTKRRRPLVVRLLRLLAFAGLALVVLLAALIGFSETQTFRSLLRDTIIDAADSSLNAKLSIETIEGNLFSGWVLGGVRLVDASGPVAEIDRVVLRYNIFRAPWKRITIKELTLNAPRIRITKAEGRDWNINTLVRPSEDTDTTSTPFDWVIAVENLRIIDGTLLVWDSTTTGPLARDRLDTGHMQIEDLNLALSALVTPKKKLLRLNQGSWTNVSGDVSLQNLSGDIALRDDGIEIDELSVQTGRSAFILTAMVEGADLLEELDTETLRVLRLRLLLDAPEVDTRDIVYFMPALDFMAGTASLRVNAGGTLEDLRIELLQLDAARSRLAFHGRLQRILDGSEMFIDVESDNTVIHGDDLPAVLPGIPLMDVSGLGETHFHRLSFTGEPLRFKAEMDMGSEAGAVEGSIDLDVRGEDLVYDAKIKTWGLDLSKVLLDPELRSDLNLQGSIRGHGTQLGRMTAEVQLKGDSTRFRKLFANTFSVDIDVHRDSMRLDLQTTLGKSSFVADGSMSFRSDSITGIQLNATAGHLDLSRLLDDEELTSDLNFTLRADADGLDPATASGEVAMVLEPSRLKDMRIERDTFLLQLHQKPGSEEYLLLQSQYADARLDGTFDLPRFASSFGMIVDSLNASFATYRMKSDSTDTVTPTASRQGSGTGRPGSARGEPVASDADTADFMDMRYTLTLKHPERIAKYFNASTFLVRGIWSGTVRGGPTGFDLGGKIEMSDFYYVDSARTWLAAGVRCTYDVTDLQAERVLEQIGMSLRFSAMDLNIDGLRLSRTQLDAD
ncbi:MAG: hypothetical protein KFF77_01635, partial [Bacteroidetes bacterium]|nr:hypothetical protein [Bacteroidota bacterium]